MGTNLNSQELMSRDTEKETEKKHQFLIGNRFASFPFYCSQCPGFYLLKASAVVNSMLIRPSNNVVIA